MQGAQPTTTPTSPTCSDQFLLSRGLLAGTEGSATGRVRARSSGVRRWLAPATIQSRTLRPRRQLEPGWGSAITIRSTLVVDEVTSSLCPLWRTSSCTRTHCGCRRATRWAKRSGAERCSHQHRLPGPASGRNRIGSEEASGSVYHSWHLPVASALRLTQPGGVLRLWGWRRCRRRRWLWRRPRPVRKSVDARWAPWIGYTGAWKQIAARGSGRHPAARPHGASPAHASGCSRPPLASRSGPPGGSC